MAGGFQGAQVTFAPGAVIFEEGDPGGDLFFIQEGEIEVFRRAGSVDIRLVVLEQGEVLGIMTCLTREARLASARALTPVKALVVRQSGFRNLITTTPPWVHTVVKDFIVRIKHMDELYANERMARLRSYEVSSVVLSLMVARGMAEVGAMVATGEVGARIVDVEDVIARLAPIYGVAKERVERVFNVFLASGLLKADPKSPLRRAEIGVLERLSAYAEVLRGYLESPERRVQLERLESRHAQCLLSFCETAKASAAALTDAFVAPISKMAVEGFAVELCREAAQRGVALGLLSAVEGGDELRVSFVPATLNVALRSMTAMRMMIELDDEGAGRGVREARAIAENYRA